MNDHMKDKTVVVTGGNNGIGLETAVGLTKLGAHVVITVPPVRILSHRDRVRRSCLRPAGDLGGQRQFQGEGHACLTQAIWVVVEFKGIEGEHQVWPVKWT